MRVIVVGLGIQGHKRRAVADSDVVAVVDPFHAEADFKSVMEVPLSSFDAALVCTPDEAKGTVLEHLLSNGKHVLVEKPLLNDDTASLKSLGELAAKHKVTCYTAYNHRFEPHFVRMKDAIESGILGNIYSVRMFYGNGTARLVRESAWRDQGAGVLPDLGSHLLDTILFWIGQPKTPFKVISAHCFENRTFDHFCFGSNGEIRVELEMTLLSWRNHFTADVFAEKGSAHIESLCKWGPSTFTIRDRKIPSGRPDENTTTLVQPDPTWKLEYEHFKQLCLTGAGNIDNDIWIDSILREMTDQSLKEFG
ncbi:Gfo/Idh/MocA family oxidoreductase [Thalassospira lucentensis]|uniref:Gfo/Idh/MocA family protein n=1 Tax=Thalassospira lucentensis TaxID=168935 RepID=UPI002941FB3F|nr:Gfo/Idh/MocA family oxidoreductase [Thalassospira lucentensis]WOI11825.1 Gfo/Idh/MocA family oxidoreductase [Thalassospira lucentensis]